MLDLLFDNRVFIQYCDFAAFQACHVVVMMLEGVAEFKLRMPAELKPADDAKLFKDLNVAVDGCLVVVAKQGNELRNCNHFMIL